MPRYFIGQPSKAAQSVPLKADYWDASPQPLPAPTVYPSNVDPIPTGLLNHEGKPIFRSPDRLGFLPDHD